MVKKSVMDIPNKNMVPSPQPGQIYDNFARQKQPREEIDQFVRLIRDFPAPRPSSEVAFMKHKNPLPNIPQMRRAPHYRENNNDILEHKVLGRTHSVGADGEHCDTVQLQRPLKASHALIENSDNSLFQKVLNQRHATSDLIPLDRTSSSLENARFLLSSSMSAHPAVSVDSAIVTSPNTKQKLARTRSDPTRRRVTADVRNLPPITVNRQAFIECPYRPSAPSPSCTPPLPSSEDEDVFDDEEPIDFIDAQ